ncbi:MAG TPA: DUF2683 family protein [archaeon]|nr:DUF2683 family protein [archaeon]
MPVAIVKLNDKTNRVINVVKAKYGLKDKSDAINRIAEDYGDEILEPEIRPEYIEKLAKIGKEKSVKVKDLDSYFEKMRKG